MFYCMDVVGSLGGFWWASDVQAHFSFLDPPWLESMIALLYTHWPDAAVALWHGWNEEIGTNRTLNHWKSIHRHIQHTYKHTCTQTHTIQLKKWHHLVAVCRSNNVLSGSGTVISSEWLKMDLHCTDGTTSEMQPEKHKGKNVQCTNTFIYCGYRSAVSLFWSPLTACKPDKSKVEMCLLSIGGSKCFSSLSLWIDFHYNT